jgi:hypothetical protein
MASDRPYRPAPELQQVLDDLERLGNPLDQMTRDNVAGLWLQREVLAARVLAPIPLAGVRDAWVPARNRVIPVRIYTPADRELACGGQLPVLVRTPLRLASAGISWMMAGGPFGARTNWAFRRYVAASAAPMMTVTGRAPTTSASAWAVTSPRICTSFKALPASAT